MTRPVPDAPVELELLLNAADLVLMRAGESGQFVWQWLRREHQLGAQCSVLSLAVARVILEDPTS